MNLLKIKKEERLVALIALLVFAAFNAVMTQYRDELYTHNGKYGYWTLFRGFEVSGFDVYTYMTLSQWDVYYELSRHPLLAVFWYPFARLNQWLMWETSINFSIYIVAFVMTVFAFWAFIFLFRLFREIIGISKTDAIILSSFFFSFGYIILSVIVPDHFGLSLTLLLLTLYLFGRYVKTGHGIKTWQSALLFIATAGVTTNNGIKLLLAYVFAHGKKVFSVRHFVLLAIIVIGMVGVSIYMDKAFVQPRKDRGAMIEKMKKQKNKAFATKVEHIKKKQATLNGEALHEDGMLKWTDVSTQRIPSVIENLWGESIQLHQKYALQDIFKNRPVHVSYNWGINYIIEALIFLLFVMGVLCSWRHPLMQLCLSWFACDMLLHVVLGFGLNEIYIMTAHWAFIIPIAIAFLLLRLTRPALISLRAVLVLLTAFLWAYNGYIIVDYIL